MFHGIDKSSIGFKNEIKLITMIIQKVGRFIKKQFEDFLEIICDF